jgi:NAD(P)-dependent dehydrogenase (short-subunit alcohol dehydrogenase family)
LARLKDKVAIITGGGKGLGHAMALLFSSEGAKVVVADIDEGAGSKTVDAIHKQGGEAIFVRADVSKAEDAEEMVTSTVDSYGRLDILVNNAAIHTGGDVPSTSEEDWDRIQAVNLKGPFLCSKYAIRQMRKQGGGNIVCISSQSGLVSHVAEVAYGVSKAGLIGLAKYMAHDHAQENIRVNVVCPGGMDTPLILARPDEEIDPYRKANLLQRFAKPVEVAYCALFLASEESSYVTGSVLVADGGYTTK